MIRGYLGGRGGWETLSQEPLAGLVLKEIQDIIGFQEKPDCTHVFRWSKAMPQYRVGHEKLLENLNGSLAKIPGIFLAGSAYRGAGIPDCIESGRRTALAALSHLQSRRSPAVV